MLRASIGTLGIVIAVLGAWAAAVPYVGPLFGYPMPPGSETPAWAWTASHTQLHLLPGIAAVVGGLLMTGVFLRGAAAAAGALLALAAGAWIVVGNEVGNLWIGGGGSPPGENVPEWMFVVTRLGYHDGTGLVIAALAALALGLLVAVRPREAPAERPVEVPPARAREREREYVS